MFYRFLSHRLKCYLKKKPPLDERKILPDVIVSLTTTPARIRKIWPTINSILLQSHLPSKIYLWIPKHYKRFNDIGITEIPEFLKNHPLIDVEFIEKDLGPASKLLPCLEKFQNNADINIVVIDDDRIYKSNLLAELTMFAKKNPDKTVCKFGWRMLNDAKKTYSINKIPVFVDVLCGYDGFLVKPKFFSKEVFNYPKQLPEAFFEDDIWISGHLKWNRTKIMRLPYSYWDKFKLKSGLHLDQNILLWSSSASFALWANENKDGNNFIMELLLLTVHSSY
ncbi:MAG: hypothetical protein NTU49_00425 [Gammaproteobacteria bacterium]|nr:hypothetical protein [Gammaproteobacteria bacterium]